MSASDRWRGLLAGLWAGWLLCVALLATPAPFALLGGAEAGRVVARMLAQEAYTSLALGIVMVLLERRAAKGRDREGAPSEGSQFSLGLALALGALFCTVLGYFGTLPLMAGARAGQGAFSFGQLHAASAVFYVIKVMLVLALAWRNTAGALTGATRRPSS